MLCRQISATWPSHSRCLTLPKRRVVLPPSVLGFYLLVALGPEGPLGRWMLALGLPTLPFTFAGLVVASVFYSLPFMVQPILNSMQALGERPLEAAATLRASPLDTFFSVVLPLCRPGLVTGCIMSFAHTVATYVKIANRKPGRFHTASDPAVGNCEYRHEIAVVTQKLDDR